MSWPLLFLINKLSSLQTKISLTPTNLCLIIIFKLRVEGRIE